MVKNGLFNLRELSYYILFFISTAVFVDSGKCYFNSLDGSSWFYLFSYSNDFNRFFSASNFDPIQGLFDISNAGTKQFLFGYIFSGNIITGNFSAPLIVSSMLVLFAFSLKRVFLSTNLFSGHENIFAIVSTVIIFMIYNSSCNAYMNIAVLSPHLIYVMAICFLICSCFINLKFNQYYFYNAAIVLSLAFLLGYEFGVVSVLFVILFISFGLSLFMVGMSQKDFMARLSVAIISLAFLIYFDALAYLKTFGDYLDIYSFDGDFRGGWAGTSLDYAPSINNMWHDFIYMMFLVNPHVADINYFSFDSVVLYSGFISSLALILLSKDKIKKTLPIIFIASSLICFSMYFIAHYFGYFMNRTYTGPNPYNFIYAHLALAPVITMYVSFLIVRRAWVSIGRKFDIQKFAFWIQWPVLKSCVVTIVMFAFVLVSPFIFTLAQEHGVSTVTYRLSTYESNILGESPFHNIRAERNDFVDVLAENIALRNDGDLFRGRVSTQLAYTDDFINCISEINLYNKDDGRVVITQMIYDDFLAGKTDFRNDLRHTGFWAYNIPTLTQISGTRSADLYLFLSSFFTESDYKQIRTYFFMSLFPESILEMLGVRYAVTEKKLHDRPIAYLEPFEPGTAATPSLTSEVCRKGFVSPIYLYEYDDPNLGQYSPQNWTRASTAYDALSKMKNEDFDPKTDGIYMDESTPITKGMPNSVEIRYDAGYLDVYVDTDVSTTIVLPVQFTNCLSVDEGKENVSIFRANFLLTGAEVKHSGEFRIKLGHGPFTDGTCRAADKSDFIKFGVNQETLEALRN